MNQFQSSDKKGNAMSVRAKFKVDSVKRSAWHKEYYLDFTPAS